MLVKMLGTISGSSVSYDESGNAIVVAPPQRGEIVEIDDETGAHWIAQRMAEAATAPVEESATVGAKGERNAALTTKAVRR